MLNDCPCVLILYVTKHDFELPCVKMISFVTLGFTPHDILVSCGIMQDLGA